jgi:hypothetical protein
VTESILVNKHNKHIHISIKENCGNDTSPWFPWMGKAPTLNKVKASSKAVTKEGEQMKNLIAKLKDPKTKAAFKSYVRAVLASAITMGLALAADLAPEQAIPNRCIGSSIG